jgi:hypothetical protein
MALRIPLLCPAYTLCQALRFALAEAQRDVDSRLEQYHQICTEKLQAESALQTQLHQVSSSVAVGMNHGTSTSRRLDAN